MDYTTTKTTSEFHAHPMRRKKQEISLDECLVILKSAPTGVLALVDENNLPYAVPLNFVHNEESHSIFFHSAISGHKIDALRNSSSASFCVIDADDVIPEKFTTAYRSIIAFGQAEIVEDADRRRHGLKLLAHKYCPGLDDEGNKEIDSAFERTCVIEFRIQHLTGKKGLETA